MVNKINLEKEVWKDINGYEGYYQVSNHGRVKSLDRYITYSNGNVALTKGKILSGFIKQNGYMSIDLYINKKRKKFHIHRLVASAFIHNPDPDFKIQVNHKDENRSNNVADNLEWVTAKENLNYGNCKLKSSISKINNPNMSIPVCQYDLDGNLIKVYPSGKEAGRQLKIPSTSITRNCKGKTQTCHGFVWKYLKEDLVPLE